MKKLFTLVVLLAAAFAYAGSYSITTTAKQDTRLERQRLRVNKATCAAAQLPANCTQAQARAVTPGVNVYSDVADLIDRLVLKGYLDALQQADTADDAVQAAAYWVAATPAQKDAVCAAVGLPNGCEIWTR